MIRKRRRKLNIGRFIIFLCVVTALLAGTVFVGIKAWNHFTGDNINISQWFDRFTNKEEAREPVLQEVLRTDLNVSVSFESADDLAKTTTIDPVPELKTAIGQKGIIGEPVSIRTTSEFEEAKITFKYDPSELGAAKVQNLRIFYYDDENRNLELVEEQSIDTSTNTVTANVSHFSIYLLADMSEWSKTWKDNLTKALPRAPDGKAIRKPLDMVYVIDSSGSMGPTPYGHSRYDYESDMNNDRIKQTQASIRLMANDDRAAVISFDSSAYLLQELTGNKDALIAAADRIGASGKTNIPCGIEQALEQLSSYGRKDANKYIVFLTDGKNTEGSDDVDWLINTAKQLQVKIFTVALGKNADRRLLEIIAEATGGDFYYADYAKQLKDKFMLIGEKVDLDIDVDTDKDGIPDWAEKKGYILQGTLMKVIAPTDPNNKDTDNDGVPDNIELGTVYYDPDTRLAYVSAEPLVYGKPHEPYRSDPTKKDRRYELDANWQVDIINAAMLKYQQGEITTEAYNAIFKEASDRLSAYYMASKGDILQAFIETEQYKFATEHMMDIELVQEIIRDAFQFEEQQTTGIMDAETCSNVAMIQILYKSQYPEIQVTGYFDPATRQLFEAIIDPNDSEVVQKKRILSRDEKLAANVFGIPLGAGQTVIGALQGLGELGAEAAIYTVFSPLTRGICEVSHSSGWMSDRRYNNMVDYLDRDQQQREQMFASIPANMWEGIRNDVANTIQLPANMLDPTKDIHDMASSYQSALNTALLAYGGSKSVKFTATKTFKGLVKAKNGTIKLLESDAIKALRVRFKDNRGALMPGAKDRVVVRKVDNAAEGAADASKRLEYLGATPGKASKTGQEVIKRMEQEGKIRKDPFGKTEFQASDGKWYDIKEADMAHKYDAVTWWNETGRYYGAKSPEVRKWMLDPNNYYLDHFSINRSQGAQLNENYLPPIK